MNDLTKWQENLSEVHISQDQLTKPLARMEYVALLSRLAASAGSDAHVYAVLRLVTTVQQAELLKQTYQDIPAEVESTYRRLTEQYMALMEAIPQRLSAQLLAELSQVPAELGKDGFLCKLRALFSE